MVGNLMEEVVKQAPFGFAYHKMLFDIDGKAIDYIFVDVNSAFEKITGLEKNKILGKKVTEVISDIKNEDFDWIKIYGEMLVDGKKLEFVQYGESLGHWYRVTAFSFEEGFFVTLVQNITNEMKQIESLDEQKKSFSKLSQELELIFNSTQDAMFLVSVKKGEFRYIRNNKAYLRIMNIEQKKIIGKTPIDFLGQDVGYCVEKNYQRCIEAEETIDYEETLNLSKGEVTCMTSLTPVFENGEIVYIVGSSKDITLQRKAEVENEKYLKRFQDMYNGHTSVMLLIEPYTGRVVDGNPAALSFYGYTSEEIRNLNSEDINMLPKEEIKKMRLAALHRKQKFNLFPHRLKNGEIKLVDVHACPIEINGEEILYSIIYDVSDREKYKEELYREKEFLRITFQSIGEGAIITNNIGKITFVNSAAEKVIGWTNEEIIGMNFSGIVRLINVIEGMEIEDPVSKVLSTHTINYLNDNTVMLHKNGNKIFVAITASPIIDEGGQIFGVVVIFRDVTVEKEQQEEILYLSYHDSLTGIYNRRFMEEELSRYDNSRQLPISIIMGDINGLKITNDIFGHKIGDRLLQKVAVTIKENCRNEDIVARWGGDEFLILLPNASGEIAKGIVNRIKDDCLTKEESNLNLSISLGYAVKTKVEENIQETITAAEEWMYHKKLLDGKSYRNAIINTLMATLYEKSIETEQHAENLKKNCYLIGRALKLSASELDELTLLSLLHDIGKIGIKESILKKPGPLTSDEWDEMKKHSEIGYRIIQNVPELSSVAEYVLYHHERWDGKGYPEGLRGNEIPLLIRILSVIDAYDAMTSDRIYKKAISKKEAIEELKRCAGTQFDAEIVEIFIDIIIEEDDIHLDTSSE